MCTHIGISCTLLDISIPFNVIFFRLGPLYTLKRYAIAISLNSLPFPNFRMRF